jgi:NADH-quinone oxidoreductase subunit I
MGLRDIIKKGAFVDILRGMSVTGTYFVVDKVTVEYPKEKLRPFPRFRGAHALLSDPETGDTKCVACMLCPTICPSQCIRVVGEQTADGRSHPAVFEIDLSRCIFCGLCEEVCPVAAIVMTNRYELSTYDKSDFLLDKDWLMANAANAHKEVFVRGLEDEAGRSTVRPAGGPGRTAGVPGAPGPSMGRALAPTPAPTLMPDEAVSSRSVSAGPAATGAAWRRPGAPKAGFELGGDDPKAKMARLLSFGGDEPTRSPSAGPGDADAAAGGVDSSAAGSKGGRR